MSLNQNLNLRDSFLWLDQAADMRCGVAAAMVFSLRRYDACTEQCFTLTCNCYT